VKFYYIDKLGWPVERIKGRPFTSAIRLLLHTRRVTTRRPRCLDAEGGVALAKKLVAPAQHPTGDTE